MAPLDICPVAAITTRAIYHLVFPCPQKQRGSDVELACLTQPSSQGSHHAFSQPAGCRCGYAPIQRAVRVHYFFKVAGAKIVDVACSGNHPSPSVNHKTTNGMNSSPPLPTYTYLHLGYILLGRSPAASSTVIRRSVRLGSLPKQYTNAIGSSGSQAGAGLTRSSRHQDRSTRPFQYPEKGQEHLAHYNTNRQAAPGLFNAKCRSTCSLQCQMPGHLALFNAKCWEHLALSQMQGTWLSAMPMPGAPGPSMPPSMPNARSTWLSSIPNARSSGFQCTFNAPSPNARSPCVHNTPSMPNARSLWRSSMHLQCLKPEASGTLQCTYNAKSPSLHAPLMPRARCCVSAVLLLSQPK